MADDQDAPPLDLEDQGKPPAKGATEIPQDKAKPPAEAPADDADPFAVRQGETLEQYATRMRGEVGWRDKQIGRQHRQKKEAEERAARLAEIEAENAQLKELVQAGKKPKADAEQVPAKPPPQPQRTVPVGDAMAEARFQVGVERLSEQLNSQKDWRQASKNLEAAGGVPREVVAAILDTDDPAYVMTSLGMNMEKFQQIMDMSEGRRRAALIKMGMEPGAAKEEPPKPEAKKPSAAPAPRVDVPGGNVSPPGDQFVPDRDDRAPIPPPGEFPKDRYRGTEYDDAWYAARAQQKRNAINRPWSVGGKGGGAR